MLDVLELVEDHGIDIELATENLDRRMAPVKAWAAKMELDSIKERVRLGRLGRLKDGKLLGHPTILGYDIEDGLALINEREAEVVRSIFDQVAWGDVDYPKGVPIKELRRRLIARGYEHKTGNAKKPWARGVIYSVLNNETYLGGMTYNVKGETYTIPVPPIIDQKTFDKARDNMQKWKRYPARSAKELGFLLTGILYCPNGHRMNYRVNRYNHTRLADGTKKRYKRKKALAYGTCSDAFDDGLCTYRRSVRLREVEQAVWDEVSKLLLKPQNIKKAAGELVSAWLREQDKHRADAERFEGLLARLKEERQRLISQGRKGVISDDDMADQLADANVFLLGVTACLRWAPSYAG